MTAQQLLKEMAAAHERVVRMAKPLIPSRPETDPDIVLAALLREAMRHAEFWAWMEGNQRGVLTLLLGQFNCEQIERRKGAGRETASIGGEERCG